MKHFYAPLALALLLAACSSTKPAPQANVDPSTDPTVVGAVDEAAREAGIQAEAAAETGHRIGIAAGVVAAVLGGPGRESVDDVIDRYRETHDAVVVTAALIGASKGATAGAKRGFVLASSSPTCTRSKESKSSARSPIRSTSTFRAHRIHRCLRQSRLCFPDAKSARSTSKRPATPRSRSANR